MTERKKLVEVDHIKVQFGSKRHPLTAVDHVSFDIYEGENVGADEKSLVYSIRFCAKDRTLEEKDIMTPCHNILKTQAQGQGGVALPLCGESFTSSDHLQ